MTKNRYYRIYNLVIETKIILPDFKEISEIDKDELINNHNYQKVYIEIGEVPDSIENPTYNSPWIKISEREALFVIDDIATFFIQDKNKITIKPYLFLEEIIRSFLITPILEFILKKNNMFVIRGVVARVNNSTVVILGNSNIGKSSIAYSLYNKDYKIISDQLVVFSCKDNKFIVYPELPYIRVTKDIIKKINCKEVNLIKIRESISKQLVSVESNFYEKKSIINGFCILNENNITNDIIYKPLKGGEKFKKIINIFDEGCDYFDVKEKFNILSLISKEKMISIDFYQHRYSVDLISEIIEKEWS